MLHISRTVLFPIWTLQTVSIVKFAKFILLLSPYPFCYKFMQMTIMLMMSLMIKLQWTLILVCHLLFITSAGGHEINF